MRHQVVGIVAGRVVGNIELPQVVVAGGEVVQRVAVRAGADPAAGPGDPLLQPVVVTRHHIVEAVDGGHCHAPGNPGGVQEHRVVTPDLPGPVALEAHPLAVREAGCIKACSIPLDTRRDFHRNDFLGH